MNKINKVRARQIIDSRGNPTIEVEVTLNNNLSAYASSPSGASVGALEGLEIRALVVVETLRMLVDNVGGDFVEECSIVGDNEYGAWVGLQIFGEEGDGWHIQHVRRFVQQ